MFVFDLLAMRGYSYLLFGAMLKRTELEKI